MYVAARKMQAHGPGGMPVTYFAGDELPQFLSWPHHIRRSMLAQHWVEFQPELAVVAQPVPPVTASIPAALLPDIEVEPAVAELPAFLECEECGRTFKDARGLGVHKSQAHKTNLA